MSRVKQRRYLDRFFHDLGILLFYIAMINWQIWCVDQRNWPLFGLALLVTAWGAWFESSVRRP